MDEEQEGIAIPNDSEEGIILPDVDVEEENEEDKDTEEQENSEAEDEQEETEIEEQEEVEEEKSVKEKQLLSALNKERAARKALEKPARNLLKWHFISLFPIVSQVDV